jgi:hypothetical protein
MSRSYRKPYWTEGYGGKWRPIAKRQAAKRVRKAKHVARDGGYKRISNSWDICDFKFRETGDSDRMRKVRNK